MPEPYIRRPNIECSICNKPFYKRTSEIQKSKSGKAFCSQKCYGEFQKKAHSCPACGKEVLSSKRSITCSKECAGRYFEKSINSRNPKDVVKDHRAIRKRLIEIKGKEQCEDCGYQRVPKVVQVHHIIERSQGGSDDVGNLKFLCPTCHCEEHYYRNLEKKKLS